LALAFWISGFPTFYSCSTVKTDSRKQKMLKSSINLNNLQRVAISRYTTAGSCGVFSICKKSYYSTTTGKYKDL
jgi:hypothetical protein